MAQLVRQSKLFAAEDYSVVYDSYLNANFKAFDFDTIRESMVAYIRETYPESFNDWIESSEFVALLDVVSQFGHNLAYRADLNARNNFLSTATKQESVYKLAEFLGYSANRNVPASGELKVTSIKTNETIIGSDGSTLAGKDIRFDSTTNISNLDDFIAVINAVLLPSNQYGNPRKTAVVGNTTTQIYNTNNSANQIVFETTGLVQGAVVPFNIVGTDYNEKLKIFTESIPNPNSAFSLMYKNDGRGIGSTGTGFFTQFKQGSLTFQDVTIEDPISGLALDVNVNNINNDDVWVQSIDTDGTILKTWTKVDNVFGFNAVYNDIGSEVRDIFAVKSRTDGQISIMFPDSSIGNVPKNIIRVWYRTGLDQTYSLRPDDIGSTSFNINYAGVDGNDYIANITVQLQVGVTNAAAADTLDDIKTNAPRIYASQDRMITAGDYNDYLVSQSTQIAKIKSVNRTHSGHSRFVDLTDPTSQYSNVRLYANDGVLAKANHVISETTNDVTAEVTFEQYIKPMLDNTEMLNLYYDEFTTSFDALPATITGDTVPANISYTWQAIGTELKSGYIMYADSVITGNNGIKGNNLTNVNPGGWMQYAQVGALLKFESGGVDYWAKVSRLFANGNGVDDTLGNPSGLDALGNGAISLDAAVPDDAVLTKIYPAFARTFTTAERAEILIKITAGTPFVIYYDYKPNNATYGWNTELVSNVNASYRGKLTTHFPTPFDETTSSWLMQINPAAVGSGYEVTTRAKRYTFTSTAIEFSNISHEYELDTYTSKTKRDKIDIVDSGLITQTFFITGYLFAENGVFDSSKVILGLIDANNDARPDSPDAFTKVAAAADSISSVKFEWNHVPDQNEIIDPSFTNVVDAYILTSSYDTDFRSYLVSDDTSSTKPLVPTIDELNQQFATIGDKKAMSDSIIYRPIKYKILFGNKAQDDLKASFSVIKVIGSSLTDNDVKSKVVDAVTEFFNITYWDFGETFYFTELAAYVHQQLDGHISSFVIVPDGASSVFGTLFQITPQSDELFVPDVSVSDIELVKNITKENIKSTG